MLEPEFDQENDEDRQMMMFLQSPEGAAVLNRLRVGSDPRSGVLDDTPPQEGRYGRLFERERQD